MSKTILITGASSGFGRDTAETVVFDVFRFEDTEIVSIGTTRRTNVRLRM